MSLTLGAVIEASRDRNPEFAKTRCPDLVFARFFTGYQREALSMAMERTPEYITGQVSIVFPPTGANINNPLGSIGAGTDGGLPAVVDPLGNIQAITQVVGNSVEMPVLDAPVSYGPSTILAATQTTLQAANAPGWGVNQWAGYSVAIVAGTDVGDVLGILSNTTDTLTVIGTSGFALVPDTTSLFTIVTVTPQVDQATAAVIGFPIRGSRLSYLVRLDASGHAYLDFTQAMVGQFDLGIQLPPNKGLLGAPTIYFSNNPQGWNDTDQLTIVDYSQRFGPKGLYSAYLQNNQLFFIGQLCDWNGIQSVDVRYIPIPGEFQALTDTFLLTDDAYNVLVSRGAEFAAERMAGLPDTKPIDISYYTSHAEKAEAIWLNQIGNLKRAKASQIREVW